MATHYSNGTDRTACGRDPSKATTATTLGEVTCKTCCNTEAYRQAAAPIPAAVEVSSAAATLDNPPPKPRTEVAFSEWAARMHNGDRRPRGKYFVRHHPPLHAMNRQPA